jgi:cyanosortase A-associated protein
MQNIWNTLRLPCLVAVLSGSVVALGVGMKTPLQPRPAIALYSFPATIPLAGWQPVDHYPLTSPEDKKLTPIASQAYQYQGNGKTLTIEMRYLTATKGDVTQFMRWYSKIPDSVATEVHQQPGKGSYVFLTYQNKAYLSSCINPQGQSTATGRQYLQSKVISGINPKQLLGWLVAKDTLFDQRCLWSHLSLPVKSPADLEATHGLLRETWGLWYDWWQTNFPNS